jgi:hypothetical protein
MQVRLDPQISERVKTDAQKNFRSASSEATHALASFYKIYGREACEISRYITVNPPRKKKYAPTS